MKRLLLPVIAAALFMSACGSPTQPSNQPVQPVIASVGGNWSGTWEDRDGIYAFVMNLNQSGSTVSGTWDLASVVSGSITGSADASSFTGNLSFNVGNCTGTASLSGPATSGSSTLRWSSVGMTGNCFNTGRITINVQRR